LNGWRAALLALLWGVAGCSNLPDIESGVCGNQVHEKGEDCDGFVEGEGKCRPPGVEGECHFDCTTGSDGKRAECPNGMGCASDGLCREPTGGFEPSQALAPDASSWLSVADFDGDGRSEIISNEPEDELGLARFRLHYFDNDARLIETRTFPRFTSRPIAAKVTKGDLLDDLLFSNGNIGVVPGRMDRDWVPVAFSSYVIPTASLRGVNVRTGQVYGGLPLATLTAIEGVSGLYVPNNATRRLDPVAKLPGSVEQLAGELLAADLFPGSESPCSEVVVAFREEHRLRVLDLCQPAPDLTVADVAWREKALEHVVELPHDVTLDAGPLSGDVDGDGHLDVVFGSSGVPYVLYGDGTRLLPEISRLGVKLLGFNMIDQMPMPLAMGDVSGDGVADYVLPQQVLVSLQAFDGSGLAYVLSSDNRGAPWTVAQIADLNGNGFPDIVTGALGETGFTFHNGTGDLYVIGVRVATQRPLRFFTTGDYDGDLIQDLAILEQGAASAGNDTLSVAYGVANGLPLPAKRVTEVEGVDQLGDCSLGAMDTLFLTTTRQTDGQSTFTLFDGSPDRLPFATYALTTFSVNSEIQEIVAASLVLGAFSQRDAKDLLALGNDMFSPEWSQWLLPDIGGLLEPPRLLEAEPPDDVSPLREHGTQSALSVAGAAADLDGDELDEALWLMPGIGHGCALLSYGVDADARQAIEKQVVRFESSCFEPELATADLDGDGSLDVLLLIGNIAAGETSRLEVLWNDGGGGFSASDSSSLTQEGSALRAFSVVPGKAEVAFVTDSGLYRAELDRGARSFRSSEHLSDLLDGRSVLVTDPNDDGLFDIVSSDANGLWLSRAELR
jgi:hypothetical protein